MVRFAGYLQPPANTFRSDTCCCMWQLWRWFTCCGRLGSCVGVVRWVHDLRKRRDGGMRSIIVCCQRNVGGRTHHVCIAILLSDRLVLSMMLGRYRVCSCDWVKCQSWCAYSVSGSVIEAPPLCLVRSACQTVVVSISCQHGRYV
jgi:hypothetical protein